MSKIICDICGTSYAETAKQCPICGCVRPGDVQRVTNEVTADENGASGYTYVKGGRFSKSNVKKRAKANSKTAAKPAAAESGKEKEPRNSRGLVIVAIVLLLAIIGVVIYIAVGFFGPISGTDNPGTTETGSSQLDLSCRGITLDTDMVILSKAGDAHLLSYKLQPTDTTDKVTFTSENPEIATVNEKGSITAVSNGETKIIIKCGEVEKVCTVYCQFEQDTTPTAAPSAPTDSTDSTDATAPADPTDSTTATTVTAPQQGTIRLNRQDMTLSSKGESWVLYSGEIAKNLITYTSDDESVATFADGTVVAVGGGMTTVYASYGDQKVSCIVRCSFQESTGVEGNGGVSEDGGTTSNGGVSEDGGASGNVSTSVNLTGKIVNVQVDVNVRSGAGTEYEKTGVLPLGQQITITAMKNDSYGMKWYQTSEGWVREDFVQLDSN